MAQTGYTPILIYSSSTASNAPAVGNLTNSTLGSELAINITDGKLFYKDNANAIQVIGWKTTPTTAGGTGLTSYTAGDLLYYATGTTLSKLAIGSSGQWLGSSGTAPQWNAPAALTKTDDTNVTLTLGGSASTALLNAASLTLGWTGTLATTRGGTGLSSFTANGVVYASSTSALATGSGFKYDGTNVMINAAPSRDNFNVQYKQLFYNSAGDGSANTVIGQIRSQVRDYGTNIATASFASIQFATSASAWYKGEIRFLTNGTDGTDGVGTEAMRIFSSTGVSIGNTTDPGATNLSVAGVGLFGTTTNSARISVETSGNKVAGFFKNDASGYQTITVQNAGASGTRYLEWFVAGTTDVGYITSNGTGVTYATLSDYRLKDNPQPMTGALDKIAQLKPCTYTWKSSGEIGQGFIAHELQSVFPDAVAGEKDEVDANGNPIYQGVDTSFLVATLVAAVQELQAKVAAFEGK